MQSEGLPPVLDTSVDEEAEKTRLKKVDLAEVLERYSPYQAWCTFLRGFITGFGLRMGVSLALRALQLLRKKPSRLLSLADLVKDKKANQVKLDAVRLGLTIGGITGVHKLAYGLLARLRRTEDAWNSLISGALSGLPLLFQEKENRRTPALYLLTRLAQCIYNELKRRNMWHFWGSDWAHGDSLLFILTSAQIMYAYVMRPETLPPSYYKFIVRSGPIDECVLEGVRRSNRNKPIDVQTLVDYVTKLGTPATIAHAMGFLKSHPDGLLPVIPCSILHPRTSSCVGHNINTFLSTSKKTLPIYATLTFVPMIVLQFFKLLRNPVTLLSRGLLSSLRSTVFLASFCAMYQVIICMQRNFVSRDHRIVYLLAGLISSFSIFIEKKGRRSELALYTLPRAVDSIYMQMLDHKWMGSVPHGDLLLFCTAMSGLTYFYHNQTSVMSPTLLWVFKWLHKSKSD